MSFAQRHRKTVHEKVRDFKCPECQMTFTENGAMKVRARSAAGIATQCLSDTSNRSTWAFAISNAYSVTAYFLPMATCRFLLLSIFRRGTSNVSAQKHIKMVHEGMRDFQCPVCPKQLATKQTMMARMNVLNACDGAQNHVRRMHKERSGS